MDRRVLLNSGVERDDIHIDQLDEQYRSVQTWSRGAVLALTSAAAIRTARDLPITVAVELFMREGEAPGTFHPRSLDDVSSEGFSWTPPSLTIYRVGSEPWRKGTAFTPLEITDGAHLVPWSSAMLQEWYDEAENNYDRRLWLVA